MSKRNIPCGTSVPANLICVQGKSEKSTNLTIKVLKNYVSSIRLSSVICLIVICLCIPSGSLNAQTTTAQISGTVRDMDGMPIEAATIQVKGIDNGTFFGTVTNSYGRFSISELRPGSYTAQASFIGYQSTIIENVVLSVASNYVVDFVLHEESIGIEEVVISESATHFNEVKTGETYNINRQTINLLPTANRSILDYTRLSPYSGQNNTMAGRDGRITALTIDGAVMNNSFGLSADLPGAGTPISLDAVQEMQVAIAPYDVRHSNFTGGEINVITKSGTNSFAATAYTHLRNERMRGNTVYGEDLGERAGESHTIIGFTIGGPILKDKLYYFVNAEYESVPAPITEWRLSQDGTAHADKMISRVTAADMDRFDEALKSYGYAAGGYDLSDGNQTNLKVLARIDWNISDNHNLMLRFNHTGNSQWNAPNARSTVGAKSASDRISQNSYVFRNNCYIINDNAWSGVMELNSRLGNNLSNKLLMTVSDVSNLRGSESSWFPHIDIRKDGDAFMSAGYELFSNGTGNYVRTYSVSDYIRWSFAHSTITAGLSYQYQKGSTNYRMYGTGYYRYASLDDFINQAAPVAFGMTYTYDNIDDPASRTSFGQSAVFIQAESQLRKNFTLTYGLRADLLQYYEPLITNLTFKQIDWTTHFKVPGTESRDYKSPVIDNGKWPRANVQWSPRIGFNWDTSGDGTLIFHGGAGIFTGRIPLVFFTTIPNSGGMLQNTVVYNKSQDDPAVANAFLDGLAGNFLYTEEALLDYLEQHECAMTSNPNPVLNNGSTSITGIDNNFKLPQVIKVSLAADYHFNTSFPLTLQVEGIYNKDINAIYVENYNLMHNSSLGHFSGTDKRNDFHDVQPVNKQISNVGGAMVLKNTNKGYSYSFCTTLKAQPFTNLTAELSYCHSNVMSVSDMEGSSLNSTWSNIPNINSPNEIVLRPSNYVIPHKLSAWLTYRVEYARNKFMSTDIGLYYTGHTSGTYSYTYTNDMNGDGVANDLIWIPESRKDLMRFDDIKDASGNVLYTAAEQREAFQCFVEHDPYLSSHLGEYAQANGARMPWVNRFDLHIAQNFNLAALRKSTKHDKETLQFSFDIMNVANMLNSQWGVTQTPSACNNGKILNYERTDNGYPVYTMATVNNELVSKSFEPLKSITNCWYMQLGLKFIFD